jgi:putative sterol carrier protein
MQEFRNVNSERLIILESQSDFGSAADSPIGHGSVADQVSVRIFESWIHEQDIRRAIRKQGNLSGPAAEHSFQRIANVMPYVFGKKVNAPEGSSVRFKIYGAHSFDIGVKVVEKRAVLASELSQATIELEMNDETFLCLACGRWDPDMAITDGRVVIKGDKSFGALIAREMNFMV